MHDITLARLKRVCLPAVTQLDIYGTLLPSGRLAPRAAISFTYGQEDLSKQLLYFLQTLYAANFARVRFQLQQWPTQGKVIRLEDVIPLSNPHKIHFGPRFQ